MSFLGCIGHLMQGSGLAELLETVYASNAVVHMLNDKAVARALRGHFLVELALCALLASNVFGIQLPTEDQETEFSHDTNEVLDDPRKHNMKYHKKWRLIHTVILKSHRLLVTSLPHLTKST